MMPPARRGRPHQLDVTSRYGARVIAIVTIFLAMPVNADVFLGVKAGPVKTDQPTAEDPLNVALALCIDLDTMLFDFGVTAELTRSASDGDTRSGADIEAETDAVYLTVKSPGTFYVKFRTGYMQEEVTVDGSSSRHSGLAWSAALGLNVGKARIELGHTLGSDETEYISVGVQFLIAGY